MRDLEKALKIASLAHVGQQDKQGMPYIFHPIRVMLRMDTDEERVVALLHDVVEDSDVTLEDLREEGLTETVVEAVDVLTRREGEMYGDFILRVKENPLAKRVKLADLADNTDETRGIVNNEKYARAILTLTS